MTTTRTLEQALAHADIQRQYASPEQPALIPDFIMLADEVKRLQVEIDKHQRVCPALVESAYMVGLEDGSMS